MQAFSRMHRRFFSVGAAQAEESILTKTDLQILKVKGQDFKLPQMARILAVRLQKKLPTFVDAAGAGAVSNAVKAFIRANTIVQGRVGVNLTAEQRKKLVEHLKDGFEVKQTFDIEGLEKGFKLGEIVEHQEFGAREELSEEDRKKKMEESLKKREAHAKLSEDEKRKQLRDKLVDESSGSRFLFERPDQPSLGFIPSYESVAGSSEGRGDTTLIRFEPVMILGADTAVEGQVLVRDSIMFPPKDRASLGKGAGAVKGRWNSWAKNSVQKKDLRPKLLCTGNDSISQGTKMGAIATKELEQEKSPAFCMLPSWYKEPERETTCCRLDLYAI